jgi:hypothetical protein
MAHAVLALLFAFGADVGGNVDEFVARGYGFATTVHVYDQSLIGPTVQMGRYGHTLRGRAWGAATEVSWDAERVTGLSGGAPVNLAYRVQPDGALRLDGMYAGNLTHLEIGPFGIRGHIGPRDFALDGRGGLFVSLMPTFYQIELPRRLAKREPGELAATLPILLAGFAGPSTTPVVPRPRMLPASDTHADLFRVTPPAGWPWSPTAPAHVRMTPTGLGGGGGGGSMSTQSSMSSSTAHSHSHSR